MITQAPASRWRERGAPFALCLLPWIPEEMRVRWNIAFEDFEEDGLGPGQSAVVDAGVVVCLLEYHALAPVEGRKVVVYVQSHESDTRAALAGVVAAFGIDHGDLPWESGLIGPARWAVVRLDEDGSEVEVARFQLEPAAKYVAREFEREQGGRFVVREAG